MNSQAHRALVEALRRQQVRDERLQRRLRAAAQRQPARSAPGFMPSQPSPLT
jgi:hypothetical protein